MKPAWLRAPSMIAIITISAQPLAVSAARADPPTQVSGVEVVTGPGPKVAASYPSDGGSVAAGVLVLKVTFDQVMTAKYWAYGRFASDEFPDCLSQPRLLADQRTFALLCTVAPNHRYAIDINPVPDFKNAYGRSARSYALRFSTNAAITRDMHAALIQAGLTDADEPLMSWRDPGKGVSQSEPSDLADSPGP